MHLEQDKHSRKLHAFMQTNVNINLNMVLVTSLLIS